MADPAVEIPGLERLMRDVLRAVCTEVIGDDWHERLSKSLAGDIEKAFAKALAQRPSEPPTDAWAAAGLPEIKKLVASIWTELSGHLEPVWKKQFEAEVDLDRLHAHRGKALHGVGQVNYPAQRAEVAAMITRLRIGFEAVRRSLLDVETNWLPYLERIETQVSGLCWCRGEGSPAPPTIRQGDVVELRLIGVNPAGSQEDLRYDIEVTGVVGPKPEVEDRVPWCGGSRSVTLGSFGRS